MKPQAAPPSTRKGCFLVDPEHGLDQKAWMITRIRADFADSASSFHTLSRNKWASELAVEFEAQFSRKLVARIFKPKSKPPRFVRYETEEEALEKTKNRRIVSFFISLLRLLLTLL
jgi:hypothetical protein